MTSNAMESEQPTMDGRSYQTEIMEQAKSENLIVCLPTGSGKTYIAIMLIKELSYAIRPSYRNGGERTVVLVPTVELARQHSESMSKHLDLNIKMFCGNSKINFQDRNQWDSELDNNQVLIFTSQVFLHLLNHNLLSLTKVNLLIFDECHHATGDNRYAVIMKDYYRECSPRPRILGLTASISGQKIEPNKLKEAAKKLEDLYQARIETGMDRIEINQYSTSVKYVPERCSNYEHDIYSKDKTLQKMFEKINLLVIELSKYLETKKDKVRSENDTSPIVDQSNFVQLQCRTLDQLKSHLDNIIHIGYDLGLYGFYLGITSLRKYLKLSNLFVRIIDSNGKELYQKIINELDSLIDNDLNNLTDDPKILYSDKVIKLKNRIKEHNVGQCIVFVERVYTAAFLCQVLRKISENSIQTKYLAGSKAYIDEISVTAKYQRQVMQEFRQKDIHVLVSTAMIEEGLDIPECSLVIRFNKPQNFSSYMQSKGRARAKESALFVILRDEPDFETFQTNSKEYENYEYMEKMLKQNFNTNYYIDSSSKNDDKRLKCYQPNKEIKIDAIRAIQILNEYCAILGNGQVLSPRFLFYTTEDKSFKCVLTMPKNCPVREDITCKNASKKLAKHECCLQMVEKLHKQGELDESCLPIRLLTNDTSDDEESEKPSVETIEKQTSYFPHKDISSSTRWHLYRINISNDDDLGFVVPSERIKVPMFNLHGRNGKLPVKIVYLKSIIWEEYRTQLEDFDRYLFEQVFDDMTAEIKSILKFDVKQSTFKLLPCLLKKSDEIDRQRMVSICNRRNKCIHNPSELTNDELYCPSHLSNKQLYQNISDESLLKRASDRWKHKKALETIESYADHFEHKLSNIRIQRDYFMATMEGVRKPRINYLKDSLIPPKKGSIVSSAIPEYFPVEILHYAPLNQTDLDLIYKLPSILVRISQLYYIEQLRKLLADNIQCYSLVNAEQMPVVTFDDCLTSVFSSVQSTVLPLVSLNYKSLSDDNCRLQPSADLLFQSITRRSADEKTDMENLEILGDCFLKLAMSLSLYHQYPLDGSGKLTRKKDKQVSNRNLYQLATKKELKNYLNVHKVVFSGEEANWIPPSYIIDDENVDRYIKQKAKLKAFADMTEALMGAFLVSTNYITTIQFMKWLGLDVLPLDKQNQIMKTPSILTPGLSDAMDDVARNIQEYFSDRAFVEIEEKIKYVFNNKAYLIAAFTHPSYYNNHLTQCYERLEYLGDAVLDFLVIRYVFVKHYNQVTPSRVTDIRHDLSNNGRLAYILVSCDLHTKILHNSDDLFRQINSYLDDDTLFLKDRPMEEKLSKDIDQWADATAPKALADVFEALVGAIFLDSGYSLDIVWKVTEPLLRQYINRSIEHPNLNPIRLFYENGGVIIENVSDGKGSFICTVKLQDGTEFTGHGKNKKLAKNDACRKAMNK